MSLKTKLVLAITSAGLPDFGDVSRWCISPSLLQAAVQQSYDTNVLVAQADPLGAAAGVDRPG